MRTWHIVGDVHGHVEQLRALLCALGWQADPHDPFEWTPPEGAMLISVGDVVDRGPDSLACLMTLKRLQAKGHAEMVLGNHECRYRNLLEHLLDERTGAPRVPESRLIAWLQLLGLPRRQHRALADWLDGRPAWLALPGAIVAHAAWTNAVRGRRRGEQIEFCAFGREVGGICRTGVHALPEHGRGLIEIDARHALPTRVGWAARWRGPDTVFWGHQTVVQGAVSRIGRTVNVESGCFMGGALSAYVHPSGEVVQVPGTGQHWRAFLAPYLPAQGILFPMSLGDVERIVHREQLYSLDDYLTWLALECEASGTPAPPPSIAAAHARLFEQVQRR